MIPEINLVIKNVCNMISRNTDSRLVLVRDTNVINWLFGNLGFIHSQAKHKREYKNLEDLWGRNMLKTRRPDLKLDKQWTNKFGEHLCEELCILSGKETSKPKKKERYLPDLEIDECIIEVKTGTYYTTGTAGEKILGCPFKYADVPVLYNKPLKIICIGGSELDCRENYGNLPGNKCTAQKRMFLDFFKNNGIEYIGATEILHALVV
jgi:hypothetical protein